MANLGTPLPIPRLRLTRQSPKFGDGVDDTPQAGPSRLADLGGQENNEEADDAQSTPKIPMLRSMSSEPTSVPNATPPMDTPAARLRALLNRVPNSPSTTRGSLHVPIQPSEPDSDFDPPRSSPTNTRSIARESLKDLFSRARRDPGDTPDKNLRRRNSIDVSEVDFSPRVERERARNKGQRGSLSDEEADKPSRSGTSLRSSQAATFDNLRARLTNSQTLLMNQHAPFDDNTPADPSGNATFLQQLERSPGTPPAATSTPQGSMHLPSQLQFQSNLLEQDLDMQKAMKDFDSLEDDSGPSQRSLSFPSSQSAPARPLPHTSSANVHSASKVHGAKSTSLSRHESADLVNGGSSRVDSPLSQADFKERELKRERERGWNKPHPRPRTPEVHLRHSHSYGSNSSGGTSPMLRHGLGRRGSTTSLKSPDDGRSSRTSSFESQAEYRERIHELEEERNTERERDWNKRHPATSRPTSSLDMHSRLSHRPERTRTQSHSSRPESVTSHHSLDHHRRKYSFNSGRSSSPTSSVQSRDSQKELELEAQQEIKHARERNWNAPRPKWNTNALPPIDHTDPHMKDNGSASKALASSTRFGWQFPRNKNPLPPLEFDEHSLDGLVSPAHPRTLSSPSPTPGSRPTSRTSASVKPSHIPVRSPHVSERNVGSPGLKKGHKRSTTELSEPAGGVHSHFSSEPIPFVKDNNHEDSVLASDEELPSPLPISTPTMRPVQLPDDHISSPGSPPKAAPNTDDTRLQKALARSTNFDRLSPTPWPPPPPEPSLTLTTPPRPQFSSSPKVEFKTPSPPRGLPELPGPPSSEEERDEEKDWMSAGRPHLDVSSMKTPKPPGAWNATPLPTHHDPLVRAHTYPDSDGFGESISEGGLATPVASWSRSSSLPAQTPLPPGAWLLTPAIDRRRSVLKVRFDIESEHSASDALADGHAHPEDVNGPRIESQSESSLDVSTPKGQSSCLPPPVEAKEEEIATPVTPRSTPPPSLRKSPSIRVVDAFGREQMSDAIVQNSTVTPVSSTPRGKSSVRIVDAMGREVEEVLETASSEGKSEGSIILDHNEALRRVRTSIADLASGLNEVDSSGNELEFHDKRLNELNDVSRAAKDARHKLSQTLRMTRSAEDNLRSKYGSLRASMRKSKLLPAIITDTRLPWTQNNAVIFWSVVFVQVLLILAMYRISTVRAKDIFLNTYYDPYYPELHLYATKPDTFRLSMAHASHWSVFTIPDTLRRGGWKVAASEAWNGIAMAVWDWQMQFWETWGTAQTVSWPPT